MRSREELDNIWNEVSSNKELAAINTWREPNKSAEVNEEKYVAKAIENIDPLLEKINNFSA